MGMLIGYDPAAFAPGLVIFALAFSLWELVWKGFGLWKAARNGHRWWFVSILVLNTLGILPLVYYFFFSGIKPQQNLFSQKGLSKNAYQQAAVSLPARRAARKAKKKKKR